MLATIIETLQENSHANGTGFCLFMAAIPLWALIEELCKGRPRLRVKSKFLFHGRPRYKRRKGSDPVSLGFYGFWLLTMILVTIVQVFDVE